MTVRPLAGRAVSTSPDGNGQGKCSAIDKGAGNCAKPGGHRPSPSDLAQFPAPLAVLLRLPQAYCWAGMMPVSHLKTSGIIGAQMSLLWAPVVSWTVTVVGALAAVFRAVAPS